MLQLPNDCGPACNSWEMLNRCADSKVLKSVSMQVQLFGVLVAPILSYLFRSLGSCLAVHREVRAVRHLCDAHVDQPTACCSRLTSSGPWEAACGNLFQSCCLLLHEFGTQPLAYHWFKAAVSFWNKVVARQGDDPSDWLWY